jgi:hypothetical protein
MAQLWFDQNTHLLELLGLADLSLPPTDPNFFLGAAIVTGRIADKDDTEIWTAVLTYLGVGVAVTREIHGVPVTTADGNYRVAVPDNISFTLKPNGKPERHIITLDADDGVDRDGFWKETISFAPRNFAEMAT